MKYYEADYSNSNMFVVFVSVIIGKMSMEGEAPQTMSNNTSTINFLYNLGGGSLKEKVLL